MNLIMCDKKCKHQVEGYCGLDLPLKVTSDLTNGCCYFQQLGQTDSETDAKTTGLWPSDSQTPPSHF